MGEDVWVLENGEKRHVRFTALDLTFLGAENVLERMFGYDRAGAKMSLYTAKRRDEGYSYDELINIVRDRKEAERVLDKLEDAGILTRKWVKDDGYWEMRFFNRGGISKPFKDIPEKIKLVDLYKKLINTKGFPREVENRLINYFAHIGEILDPHYLIIEGSLEREIPYEKLWRKMQELKEEIKADGVYEADTIIAYHPSRKKIGIFGIPVKSKSIETPERKLRFVFFLNGGGEARRFQMVPVISPIIPCITECSYDYEHEFCNKDFEKYRKAYGEEEVCRDCILFNITTDTIPELLCLFGYEFNAKIKNCSWDSMSRKYRNTEIGKENKIEEILTEKLPELEKLFESTEPEIQEPYEEYQPPRFLREEIGKVESEIKDFMERVGNYAKENGYKSLVIPSNGYALVKHKIDGKTIEERLKEKGVEIISDEELRYRLMSGENSEELGKVIVVGDAIDEGRYVAGVIRDLYNILGKERFGEMDIKVGAYLANKSNINRLKEELKEKYGKEFIQEGLLYLLVPENENSLR